MPARPGGCRGARHPEPATSGAPGPRRGCRAHVAQTAPACSWRTRPACCARAAQTCYPRLMSVCARSSCPSLVCFCLVLSCPGSGGYLRVGRQGWQGAWVACSPRPSLAAPLSCRAASRRLLVCCMPALDSARREAAAEPRAAPQISSRRASCGAAACSRLAPPGVSWPCRGEGQRPPRRVGRPGPVPCRKGLKAACLRHSAICADGVVAAFQHL